MKLHIGGQERKDGWKVLNVQPGPHVDFVGDFRDLSQFADESIETAYASHVLEHVSQVQVVPVLMGVRRALKKGGKLMISVPDMDVLCHLFTSPWASMQVKWHTMRMIFGGQIDAHDYHYIGFNEQILGSCLAQAGFAELQRVATLGLFQDTSDFKPYGFPISLNMIATK